MESLQTLFDILPQVGRIEWIGLRPKRLSELISVNEATLIEGRGIEGDHKVTGRAGTKRQVTLIQQEHLIAVAGMLHRDEVSPGQTRRNIVVSGINLLALKGKQFRIGQALLEFSGPCEPCSRMEQNLGPGGFNAMRGHGGITAKVIEGGAIRVGDEVLASVKQDGN
ncbi:MAG: MOSC domain-containing protein [Planctomycetales bacterium]|nr:MOSC domain-containing protein [Planctomycetales bacterium]